MTPLHLHLVYILRIYLHTYICRSVYLHIHRSICLHPIQHSHLHLNTSAAIYSKLAAAAGSSSKLEGCHNKMQMMITLGASAQTSNTAAAWVSALKLT